MSSVTRTARGAGALASAAVFAFLLLLPGMTRSQDAAAPAAQPQGLSEHVVASVNDEAISTYDLYQRMRLLMVLSGVQPTSENLTELQREALRSLVDERLEMQELRYEEKEHKLTIVASDADIDDEIEDIAKNNNTTAPAMMATLAQSGVGPDTFRAQLRAQMSWQRWIRGRYSSRLTIGEDQIKAFQVRAAAESNRTQYQISEIFIDAQRAGSVTQAVDAANQLIGQLRQGAPFANVAKQFSAASTAANGGDAGWVTEGEIPAEVASALSGMRAGTLSTPIPVKDGAYIVLLRDKRTGGGSAMLIGLKQAAISLPADAPADQVEAATAKLAALRGQLKGCDGFEATAGKVDGVLAGDLGEAETKDLVPAFRSAAESLPLGGVSEPLRSDVGVHLIAVCSRRNPGAAGLDHDQIENRLYGVALNMIMKRSLRDLNNSATIDYR